MTWHPAGTYRIEDGRGGGGDGAQRFAPLNSWPDNGNLDKARRLLWPVKQKYGQKLSWADLLVLAGNVALEDMGFETFGFAFGREDIWEPEEVFWGPEDTWLGDERYSDRGRRSTSATTRSAPSRWASSTSTPRARKGNADPASAAHDIRLTFARMAMNDEETVALIAGGHTFGKTHGAGDPDLVGPEPEGCPVHGMGLGWKNDYGTGKGADTITSGLEGAWTPTPTQWDNSFWDTLFGYEWELDREPGRRQAVEARRATPAPTPCPTPTDPDMRHPPMMATTDLALLADPEYRKISERFRDNPDQFADAFARAWYKLLHRDMGPVSRYLGPWVPEPQLWQDPVPPVEHELIGDADIAAAQGRRSSTSGLSVSQLVLTAWASASTYRDTDKRGGANGARIRLAPQKDWEVNEPADAGRRCWRRSRASSSQRVRQAGLARRPDRARRLRGGREGGQGRRRSTSPCRSRPGAPTPRRSRPTSSRSRCSSPSADGFRNYLRAGDKLPPEKRLLDQANLLSLTAPEMTVLVGGLRVLGANTGGSCARRLHRPGRHAHQRLLRQPARRPDGVDDVDVGGGRLRGATAPATADRGRPRLRLELAAAGHRRGLRVRRRQGEVRAATSWPRGTRS